MISDEEVRKIVRAVFEEENERHANNLDDVVLKTLATILSSFGIEDDDRKELRADFQHLRKWRKSVERVENVGWGAAITVIVSGLLGALWLGVKTLLGK